MALTHPAAAKLKARFPGLGLTGSEFRGQTQIAVPRDHLLEAMRFLKEESGLGYDMLSDVTCVDYLNYPARRTALASSTCSTPSTPARPA